MTLTLAHVVIPAHSTIGYGYGLDDAGRLACFAGDHRLLRQLGEALACGEGSCEEPVIVEVEDWQVLGVEEVRA